MPQTPNPYAKLRPYAKARERSLDEAAIELVEAKTYLRGRAVEAGLTPGPFERWLLKQSAPMYAECRRAVKEAWARWGGLLAECVEREKAPAGGSPEAEALCEFLEAYVRALDRLIGQIRALQLPPTLHGRTRGRVLNNQTLLDKHDRIRNRARTFLQGHGFRVGVAGKKWMDLGLTFPEAEQEDLELLEKRKAGAFAIAVLARHEDLKPDTIRKRLIAARKEGGRSRPRSRLA